ncbi:hypothetical protein SLEP1_g58194 [Rubroshorea leprosula]|uniref:Uncharacterized protein n=1 Tax=Rubroshorea leprosula TaxID=152421 RepID=A0AAV5MS54_9ROSI|nr:hypothetical protein SLEP1_g58194 [Rubroshorea leprosula]
MAADAVLGAVLKLTLSKVISAANEQLNLVVGFHQELRRFHVTLGMTWGVLDDAEQKQVTGRPDLKHWLEELWSISEEADDLMDEIAYENLRREVVSQKMLKQVSYFFTPLNPLAFRLKMGIKIKNLNAALVDLNDRATRLGLQHRLANRNPEPRGIQQTVSLLGEPSRVIGRDGDVQKIVELLIHDSSNQQPLCVVSIVGIAGLGKTTLAKLVRNNYQIQRHFWNIMWICVSENFDVKRILVQMLESLTKAGCENITSQDVVVQKIKENLGEKKYLLVLDDVWNEDRLKWEDLRQCLLGISETIGSNTTGKRGISDNTIFDSHIAVENVYIIDRMIDEDVKLTMIMEISCLINSIHIRQPFCRIYKYIRQPLAVEYVHLWERHRFFLYIRQLLAVEYNPSYPRASPFFPISGFPLRPVDLVSSPAKLAVAVLS